MPPGRKLLWKDIYFIFFVIRSCFIRPTINQFLLFAIMKAFCRKIKLFFIVHGKKQRLRHVEMGQRETHAVSINKGQWGRLTSLNVRKVR